LEAGTLNEQYYSTDVSGAWAAATIYVYQQALDGR
jgi:hypothetical protein